ncbi:hypothetical protein Cs7R123_09530 [Catellatospora sp. TT07R-123]|uniref:hypothetical protein n=1 Tax=Catellatospora sp. TT07R-123 TaxID=2733863 RepID=UPI001B0BD0C7|nr:hypothetical protein [Catellatospora sp. TT07R-123]GHJ43611.1 hypothetical protein Cs7R123_09530 [Catellatospora sp. TT07R-123]
MPRSRDLPHRLAEPVRGVQAYLSAQGGTRPYAMAVADFEPPGDTGSELLAFVNEVPADRLPSAYADAFGAGALDQLRSWTYRDVPVYSLLVRLRDGCHAEGSTEAGFAWAGRRAVHEAVRCVEDGGRPRRYTRRPGEGAGGTAAVGLAFQPVHDVRVRLVTAAACGVYAVATTDFEPLPATSDLLFEFACELPDSRLPWQLAEAFERGVHEQLCAAGADGAPPAPVRVRLRDARWHEVDSTESIFTEAGRRAAAEALRCQAEGAVPAAIDPWPRRVTST